MLIESITNDPHSDGYEAAKSKKGLEECQYVPFSEGFL